MYRWDNKRNSILYSYYSFSQQITLACLLITVWKEENCLVEYKNEQILRLQKEVSSFVQ